MQSQWKTNKITYISSRITDLLTHIVHIVQKPQIYQIFLIIPVSPFLHELWNFVWVCHTWQCYVSIDLKFFIVIAPFQNIVHLCCILLY